MTQKTLQPPQEWAESALGPMLLDASRGSASVMIAVHRKPFKPGETQSGAILFAAAVCPPKISEQLRRIINEEIAKEKV